MMGVAQNRLTLMSIGVREVRGLAFGFRLLALGSASVYTWAAATSYSMNADGISYLDMGDAYLRGDWEVAINAVWSPLYALLLSVTLHILNPPMRWEFPTVHLVNLSVFLVALFCFEFFWQQMMRLHERTVHPAAGLPPWALLSIGYLLFITSSLILIEIWSVTPDMMMSAFVYLAAGLVVRIRLGDSSWRLFILLGLVLGLGYLTKAFMFPVAILLLGTVLFSGENLRRAGPRVVMAFLIFASVALPYIFLISMARGRLTISDAGAFTYAKHVNGVPFAHWQGEMPGNGTPVHPTRLILERPPVYEFATPIGGTYPVGYDPVYWYEGLETYFNWRQQTSALLVSGLFFLDIFVYQYGALLFGAIVLYTQGQRQTLQWSNILSHWGLAIVALAVFAFYSLVGAIGRYVGVFIVLFWADVFVNVRLPRLQVNDRLCQVIGGMMISSLVLGTIYHGLGGYRDLVGTRILSESTSADAREPAWPGQVTEALQQEGVQEGAYVGVIGYGFDSYWARLGRWKIVAELPAADAEPFWSGSIVTQGRVIEAFASTGVKAIVAEHVPGYASLPGWHQIADSNYYFYLLTP